MATVKIRFRPSSIDGQPGSIVYAVIHHRTVRTITTDYKVYPEEWDNATSRLKKTPSKERMKYLSSVAQKMRWDKERLTSVIRRFDDSLQEYNAEDIVHEYLNISQRNMFFIFMEDVINRLMKLDRKSTAGTYQSALRSFKSFRRDDDLPLNAVSVELMEDYQSWLMSKGVTMNSVSFYMRILRAVYNRAVEQDLIQDSRPFRKVYTGIAKTLKRAVSMSDIKRIAALDLSHKPAQERARDLFMLQFYLRGISFIDLAFLKKSDLQNGFISYNRHKTDQRLTIRWEQPMAGIVAKYNDETSPYLLSLIDHSKADEPVQYQRILSQVNYNLKHVGRLANISIPLTTYVSRHAWASIAKTKNIPVSVISDSLGHDSEKTTLIYLSTLDTSEMDNANAIIIKDLFAES